MKNRKKLELVDLLTTAFNDAVNLGRSIEQHRQAAEDEQEASEAFRESSNAVSFAIGPVRVDDDDDRPTIN